MTTSQEFIEDVKRCSDIIIYKLDLCVQFIFENDFDKNYNFIYRVVDIFDEESCNFFDSYNFNEEFSFEQAKGLIHANI